MGITRAKRLKGVRRRIVHLKIERDRLAPYPEMFAVRLQQIELELKRLDQLVTKLTTKEVA